MTETESGIEVARGQGEVGRGRELMFDGDRVSVWEDNEKVWRWTVVMVAQQGEWA